MFKNTKKNLFQVCKMKLNEIMPKKYKFIGGGDSVSSSSSSLNSSTETLSSNDSLVSVRERLQNTQGIIVKPYVQPTPNITLTMFGQEYIPGVNNVLDGLFLKVIVNMHTFFITLNEKVQFFLMKKFTSLENVFYNEENVVKLWKTYMKLNNIICYEEKVSDFEKDAQRKERLAAAEERRTYNEDSPLAGQQGGNIRNLFEQEVFVLDLVDTMKNTPLYDFLSIMELLRNTPDVSNNNLSATPYETELLNDMFDEILTNIFSEKSSINNYLQSISIYIDHIEKTSQTIDPIKSEIQFEFSRIKALHILFKNLKLIDLVRKTGFLKTIHSEIYYISQYVDIDRVGYSRIIKQYINSKNDYQSKNDCIQNLLNLTYELISTY